MFKKSALLGVSALACLHSVEPFTPESLLGTSVAQTVAVNPYTGESGAARTGSVAATMNNIVVLNKLLETPNTPEASAEIRKVTAEINHLIPSLRVIGIFDFFPPLDWIGKGEQLGRVLAAILYLKQFPDEITPEISTALNKTFVETKSEYLKIELENLLPAVPKF